MVGVQRELLHLGHPLGEREPLPLPPGGRLLASAAACTAAAAGAFFLWRWRRRDSDLGRLWCVLALVVLRVLALVSLVDLRAATARVSTRCSTPGEEELCHTPCT
jgi:hypothetical protein